MPYSVTHNLERGIVLGLDTGWAHAPQGIHQDTVNFILKSKLIGFGLRTYERFLLTRQLPLFFFFCRETELSPERRLLSLCCENLGRLYYEHLESLHYKVIYFLITSPNICVEFHISRKAFQKRPKC